MLHITTAFQGSGRLVTQTHKVTIEVPADRRVSEAASRRSSSRLQVSNCMTCAKLFRGGSVVLGTGSRNALESLVGKTFVNASICQVYQAQLQCYTCRDC